MQDPPIKNRLTEQNWHLAVASNTSSILSESHILVWEWRKQQPQQCSQQPNGQFLSVPIAFETHFGITLVSYEIGSTISTFK